MGTIKISYLGTTVLLFDDGKNQILFDAHVTRPSVYKVAFGKLATDDNAVKNAIDKFEMNRLSAIFISHTHYDHVLDMPAFADITGADVYGSYSCRNVAKGGGIPDEKIHVFKGNEEYEIGDYKIKVLNSIHSKAHFYNNDLGKTIDKPLIQPASKKEYKEGNSFDFIVENGGERYIIRPSFNYLNNQWNDIKADVLFLGIGGIHKSDNDTLNAFFKETVEKIQPKTVIPVHWDNFMQPIGEDKFDLSRIALNVRKDLDILQKYSDRNNSFDLDIIKPMTTRIFDNDKCQKTDR